MSWMDSWSRPSKSQATPAPYYLLPGGEDTPYCHSCGRVISSKRSGGSSAAATAKDKEVKYCSSRCRSHKPGKLDREIEGVFVGFLSGALDAAAATTEGGGDAPAAAKAATKSYKGKRAGAGVRKTKGDARVLVACDDVERHVFPPRGVDVDDDEGADSDAGAASGAEHGPSTDGSCAGDLESSQQRPAESRDGMPAALPSGYSLPGATGTLQDPAADAPVALDYDRLVRLSIRSGTRIRPPQAVSEVNGSVGGEKGRAERVEETEGMLEKRREGLRRVRQREMVRCAARRGVVFGFLVVGEEEGAGGKGDGERRKCEAVMSGKVVEPSFAKGNWSVRWRE